MNTLVRRLCLAALLAACRRDPPAAGDVPPCHRRHGDASTAAVAPLPGASLFHLEGAWSDQAGAPFRFASLRGSPAVILMFYGTCQAVCPILIGDTLRLEAALAPAARARTRFVLVTFDPGTDTPERLRALAAERGMDLSRWSLVRGADGDVRALATVLGVQYSRVGPRDFTHSNVITVVDPQGVVARQVEGLRQPVDAAARAIEALSR